MDIKWFLALVLCLFISNKIRAQRDDAKRCNSLFTKTKGQCQDATSFVNLPPIDGAYCPSDGTYVCKIFSGRFEFLYDLKSMKILGPVPKSRYVDQYGFHERVPVSYNINGEINYADRAINWASIYVKQLGGTKKNLLASDDFNWCAYTASDFWPYKSAIKDKTGRYQIYFHNRQSCIYDLQEKRRQHYNTRFLHDSNLRIDLDINPTIFAIQDPRLNDTFLIKHRRQHWWEVSYEVLRKPSNEIDYFVLMEEKGLTNCIICGSQAAFIPKTAYENFTDTCISDRYFQRSGKNSQLVPAYCGYDGTETADVTSIETRGALNGNERRPNEVSLHGIPRYPKKTEDFFNVKVQSDEDWMAFAKDGYSFTAHTTYPSADPKYVEAIFLYAIYGARGARPKDKFDENYPLPRISKHRATTNVDNENYKTYLTEFDQPNKASITQDDRKNLNYVDDIAWLYQCKTILVIFGPLYTEVPAAQDARSLFKEPTYLGSIIDLAIWEPVKAFFNEPGTDIIWIYHRMNYITSIKYTCARGGQRLVTAVKDKGGKYFPSEGRNSPKSLRQAPIDITPITEEEFFKALGVYRGNSPPEAPDPRNYPLPDGPLPEPAEEVDNTWIYVIVAIAVLLIIAMCLICMLTLRRRGRRRLHKHPTGRSGMNSSGASNYPSQRSKLASSNMSGIKTQRTGFSSGIGRGSSTRTSRSNISSRAKSSRSNATERSGIPSSTQSSATRSNIRSSTNSAATTRSNLPSASTRTPGSTKRSSLSRSPSPNSSNSSIGTRSRHSSLRSSSKK